MGRYIYIHNTEIKKAKKPLSNVYYTLLKIIVIPFSVLRVRSTDKARSKDIGKFFIHTMQLLPMSSCRKLETLKIISVKSDNEPTLAFKCEV